MALILDTGPLYALLDRRDRDHQRCRRLVERAEEQLVVPEAVLPEVDYLVTDRMGPGPMVALLRDIESGAYVLRNLNLAGLTRVREFMDQYADSDIGYVDAYVLASVEQLAEPKVCTLDHRHFAIIRPRHVAALMLLPE
jgi:predicted nucleic acid-binding protein